MYEACANSQMVCSDGNPRSRSSDPCSSVISRSSASDVSEGVSDMSLSTSPGSDVPRSLDRVSHVSSSEVPPSNSVRKRVVVRQLSSNPYLASSEMSPTEELDHSVVIGSNSYAAGESKQYLNGEPFEDDVFEEYLERTFQLRASSLPAQSDVFENGEENEKIKTEEPFKSVPYSHDLFSDSSRNKSETSELSYDKPSDPPTSLNRSSNDLVPSMHESSLSGLTISESAQSKNNPKSRQRHHHHHQHHNANLSNSSNSQNHNTRLHKHHSHTSQNQQAFSHKNCHHNHNQQQKHDIANMNIIGESDTIPWDVHSQSTQNPGNHRNTDNILLSNSFSSKHSSSKRHDRRINTFSNNPPQSREISSWGHFSRPADGHYKYRRSQYTSDSDEDDTVASSRRNHTKPHSSRSASSKSHLSKCVVNHRSPSQSPCVHRKSLVAGVAQAAAEGKPPPNGIKPHVFKDRFQVMKRWFSESNDGQKNIILKGLLGLCELPQLHLLSVHMSATLHHGCPSNCEDLLTWLPADMATRVMSYLDPVSLCRAAQVCSVWRRLAEDQSLWRRFCCQAKWRLSKAAEHKQVISHMCPEGSIQWKNVFAERFRLRNNWLKGRCTVRTFEGHLQGISCVQFDDSRIVSGSSDKTIKVWNMRTNAPWSVQTLMGHHATVRCLHLEGNRLVSGSCDNSIKVWDLSTQESWSSIACKVTMTGHSDTVRCLQADDDKVISGSYDKTLKIWDLKSGVLRKTLSGHQASVLCVHFSETKIVSGSADKTIKLWNYTGSCMMTLGGHQDAVTCLMFDSTRVVSGSLDHNLKFWDIHTGECLNTIDWKKAEGHTDVVRCLQADSWRVVSAADDKTIKVWNLATGERLVTLRNHTDGVTCLQFNDFIIVSGSYDKTVKLWDFSCC